MIIGIIGGGASGMAAALSVSPEHQVLLFERQARVGRKLLATGNGRCNLSNKMAIVRGYHGEDPAFVRPALSEFTPEETRVWFRNMGLYTVSEESGKVYPYSDQANSVVDVLRLSLEQPHIQLLAGTEITKVRKTSEGFQVESVDGKYLCDRLIVACGGLAGTKLGGSMSGYKILRSLGHRCTRLRPALVQLTSDWNGCVSLKGVRAECHVSIYRDGVLFNENYGEIQFTEYGLSGPVIFEISRDVCQDAGQWVCKLDFLPEEQEDLLRFDLYCRQKLGRPVEDYLTGMLHNRLGRVLMHTAGIRGQRMASDLRDEEILELAGLIKGLEIPLTGTLGMDSAQVTAGGIVTSEFDANTMESRIVPDLYACGEVLDVDGDCGGYNLQWAWSSGRLAGQSAGGYKI